MASQSKKREWFELGARACAEALPGLYSVPTYLCHVCVAPFTSEAVFDGALSVEHVPPRSLGGQELLLTCTQCNNVAGTKLDASASTQEEVRLAMRGAGRRPHRVKVHAGHLSVNGHLHTESGAFSLCPCQFQSVISAAISSSRFRMQLPERRIRQCGDATGAPTRVWEQPGAATPSPGPVVLTAKR